MFLDIKYPFAHLIKGDNTCVFFEHNFENEYDEPIASWDDIPDNFPRWALATHSRDKAIHIIKGMVKDGWELNETSEKELMNL